MVVENQALYPIHKTHLTLDQINAPLIITIPFTHKDMRDYLKGIHVPGYDKVEKSLRYVLSQPTNKNYTVDFRIEEMLRMLLLKVFQLLIIPYIFIGDDFWILLVSYMLLISFHLI